MSPDLLVVVLAAGASRRLGRAKQLVSVDGEPLLRRQVRCALEAGVGPVLVVLGCDAGRQRQVISDLPVEVAMNHDWREGMAASVRHAVSVADQRSAAMLVLPCDQYRIVPDDLRTLRDRWRLLPSTACVSRWDHYTGPPAILPSDYYAELLNLRGDSGARNLLYDAGRPSPQEIANPRALYDLDCPEDLTTILDEIQTPRRLAN